MKQTEGLFKGARGTQIYYHGWLPDGDTKAVILLVHGLGEYCGRHLNLVNHFVPLGYAVYGLDHAGHGKSGGERELVESFADYTDTLAIYHDMVSGWQPDKPVFVYGHSMGGLIVCDYLLNTNCQAKFSGAILSAPALKPDVNATPALLNIVKLISRIAPKTKVLALDPNGISRDKEVVSTYINDPLVYHDKTPARLVAEMVGAMERVSAGVKTITLPITIVRGSADRLVNPVGAQMLYDNAGSADKTLKTYDGAYHEVHNEPEREEMFRDIEIWLDKHL